MTYHVVNKSRGWLYAPEDCLLPWTRLAPIYQHINQGRFVGMFGTSIA